MRKVLLGLLLAACAAISSGQIIDFAYHLTSAANPLDGGLAGNGPVGPYSGTPVLGDIIYFNGTNWVSLNKPADGTYSVTFTAGIPSWASSAVTCAGLPALTGAVTTSAGSCATSYASIASGTQLANMTQSSGAPVAFDVLDTRRLLIDEDFCNNNTGRGVSTGAGAGTSTVNGTAADPCMWGINAGTTNTGVQWQAMQAANTAARGLIFGGGTIDYRTGVGFSALSAGAETYKAFAGFFDTTAAGVPNNGCYFHYDQATRTTWGINCRNGGTGVEVDCGATVTTAQQNLRITVNAAGTSAHFYTGNANGGQGTECSNSPISTNIPTSNRVDIAWKIDNLATAGGGGNGIMNIDYLKMLFIATTAR